MYQGARPMTLVTATVEGDSKVETLRKLMEGLGVSYALRTDATGERVGLLILIGDGDGTEIVEFSTSSAHTSFSEPTPGPAHQEVSMAEPDPEDRAVQEAGAGEPPAPELDYAALALIPGHPVQKGEVFPLPPPDIPAGGGDEAKAFEKMDPALIPGHPVQKGEVFPRPPLDAPQAASEATK